MATQGRHKYNQWVTSYTLSYSVDGAHWVWYRLSNGHIKVWLTCNGISGKSCSIRNQTMHLTFNQCITYLAGFLKTLSPKYTSSVKQFFSAINSKVANVKLRVQPLLYSLLLISFSSPFHRDFSMHKITRKHEACSPGSFFKSDTMWPLGSRESCYCKLWDLNVVVR